MKEQGSLLLEVIVACAVLAVLSMAALPRALAIYREAALEYEMQCLLSDIRYVREISRTTQVWPKSMKGKAEQQLLSSLPRHMLRRLEAEQREADEGAPKAPPPCLPASWLAAAQGSFARRTLRTADGPPSAWVTE